MEHEFSLRERHGVECRDRKLRLGYESIEELFDSGGVIGQLPVESGRGADVDLDRLPVLTTAHTQIQVTDSTGYRITHAHRASAEGECVFEHHRVDAGTEDLTVGIDRPNVASEILSSVAPVLENRDQGGVETSCQLADGFRAFYPNTQRQNRRRHRRSATHVAPHPSGHRYRDDNVVLSGGSCDVRDQRGHGQASSSNPGVGRIAVELCRAISVEREYRRDRRQRIIHLPMQNPRRFRSRFNAFDPVLTVGLESRRVPVIQIGCNHGVE